MTCLYLCTAADTVPEFLLKDEDEDEEDADIDVDPCALSPSNETTWPVMSWSGESDCLPAVDDLLSTVTGKYSASSSGGLQCDFRFDLFFSFSFSFPVIF